MLDKETLQSIKRSMEIRKRNKYTLLATRRQCKKKHSPIRIHDDTDDEDTPPPPPPPPPRASPKASPPPSPPPSPPKKKDNNNIIVQKLIMRMSPRDWYEFISTHEHHASTILGDLRKFSHSKYIHAENTGKRDKWGKLCNLAEYPLVHRPYEEDFSAKRKLNFDPISPQDQPNFTQPSSFIQREFAGSQFPVYMSKEKYVKTCLTPQPFRLPCGYLTETIPQDPPYKLYRINEGGKWYKSSNKLNCRKQNT